MEPRDSWPSEKPPAYEDEPNQKQFTASSIEHSVNTIDQNFIAVLDTFKIASISRSEPSIMDTAQSPNITEDKSTDIDSQEQVEIHSLSEVATHETFITEQDTAIDIDALDSSKVALLDVALVEHTPASSIEVLDAVKVAQLQLRVNPIDQLDTHIIGVPSASKPLILQNTAVGSILTPIAYSSLQQTNLKRGTIIPLLAILGILVLRALTIGPTLFIGSQGWASVLSGPSTSGNGNLLKNISTQLRHTATPGSVAKVQMTPQQYINLIVSKMTLDQKLGQMMIVQFTGATYGLPISTMISQYNVGAVLIFSANGNIISKEQLSSLIRQMKANSSAIPLAVAIDQEGGTVDRLINLDGPRPAEATIGATNDPVKAKQAGMQDAQDLSSYGFNLNLAPVVDVTTLYNPQLYHRTYGNSPDLVTRMAAAYLQGLQQSGKVVGTLKHFPGLGDVSTDPHLGIPYLKRPLSELEQIDWAPYRALIQQGNVHAIMVTHEIVSALDKTVPSSLSPKIIQGILRNELGFQGVIMTDSLTMEALTAYASEAQAATLSIQAGADLLMGAGSPQDVASMMQGIKQAMSTGAVTEQRIDASVQRILMMKYAMGLLPIPRD